MPTIRHAPLRSIDPETLYRIMQLRVQVFVYEQGIVTEPELDGRDTDPSTELFWIEEDGTVVATLRLLHEDDGAHLGRVATAPSARGRGLAGRLIEAALPLCSPEVRLSAQAQLESWYTRFGFVRSGENYIEAGIDHVPMRLADPTPGSRPTS